jgi:hypothetical protein
MKAHGRTSVHEFLGDLIVYRNLVPLDPRLPPLSDIGPSVGLPEGVIPRKSEPAYARAIVHLLRQARALEAPGARIERLVYVGDTRLNDGTAFANICRAGGWPGYAFIAAEGEGPAQVEISESLYLSNRWAALADFDRFCHEQGLALDEGAAVIVDLDKTALGARGRNDQVIDRARVEAVRRTVGDLLGDRFDAAGFQGAYDCLNQPEFHPFTTDNQDYLAYTCLILGSGLLALEALVSDIRTGRLVGFEQFIDQVDGRFSEFSPDLREIHESVMAYVRQGDPTPFKAFRHNEYQATVERMGWLPDGAPVAQMLEEELLITQEVRAVALDWRERGALLFGLSDKPDEASLPDDALAAQGYRPIHQMTTHAVGG